MFWIIPKSKNLNSSGLIEQIKRKKVNIKLLKNKDYIGRTYKPFFTQKEEKIKPIYRIVPEEGTTEEEIQQIFEDFIRKQKAYTDDSKKLDDDLKDTFPTYRHINA